MHRPLCHLSLLTLLALALLTGCSRSKSDTTPYDGPAGQFETVEADPSGDMPPGESIGDPEGSRPRPADDALQADGRLRTLYFDYDSSRIRSDQLDTLEGNRQYMAEHPELQIIIEGHCDERGTVEYNFALGERRAGAVRQYFIDNGIDPERIMVVSKGEEQPAVQGDGEQVWSLNRRAEFIVAE